MESVFDPTVVLPATDGDELIKKLNRLIEVCKDGEDGYMTAAADATLPTFRAIFQEYAQQRGRYAADLAEAVRSLGGEPQESGTVVGTLRAGWLDVKASITGNDERGLLIACEKAEQSFCRAYEDTLRGPLPVRIEALVRRQHVGIRDALERLRGLRDAPQN